MDALKNAVELPQLKKYFQEAFGTCVWIMLATAGGGDSGWAWAISFVVMTTFFGDANHFHSYYTLYRMLCGKRMCMFGGVFYLLSQFLGAFAAGKISGLIGHTADAVTAFEFSDWQTGVKEMVMVSLFLWLYLHAKDKEGGDVGGMPNNLFILFSVYMCFMWFGAGTFNFARCWMDQASIKACGPAFVWGMVAVITTNFKRWMLDGEGAFWEGWF